MNQTNNSLKRAAPQPYTADEIAEMTKRAAVFPADNPERRMLATVDALRARDEEGERIKAMALAFGTSPEMLDPKNRAPLLHRAEEAEAERDEILAKGVAWMEIAETAKKERDEWREKAQRWNALQADRLGQIADARNQTLAIALLADEAGVKLIGEMSDAVAMLADRIARERAEAWEHGVYNAFDEWGAPSEMAAWQKLRARLLSENSYGVTKLAAAIRERKDGE